MCGLGIVQIYGYTTVAPKKTKHTDLREINNSD